MIISQYLLISYKICLVTMNLSEIIGDFGRYQFWLNVLLFFCKYGMAFQYLASSFLAPPMTYTCPSGEKCCYDPVFNTTEFYNTMQTQWNLICERAWLVGFSETIFKCGMSIGSLTFGMASDEYGRRKPIIVASIIESLSGILAALCPYDYWVFTFLRMVTGYSIGGLMVVVFVLIIESIGVKSRDFCSAIHQLTFTIGHLSLAILGYFVRDFTHFQLIISCFSFILFVYICAMPESPRWLLAVGRTDDAVAILEIAAKINNLPINNIKKFAIDASKGHNKHHSILDLCRYRKLTRFIILVSLNWFTCHYYFFGVTRYIDDIAEDVFTRVMLEAVVGNLGVVISIPLMARMGRVPLMVLANVVCGVCAVTAGFISQPIIFALLGVIGVMFNCVVFVVIFVQCCELFPTVLRGTALGLASMTACMGSITAPLVARLRPFGEWCAPMAYGALPLLVALLYAKLPETKGVELTDTIDESCKDRPRRRVIINQLPTKIPEQPFLQPGKKTSNTSSKNLSKKSSTPEAPREPSTSQTPPPREASRLSAVIERKQSEDAEKQDKQQ